MKEISKHCSDLGKLISGYEPEIEWPIQLNWLQIASGIVNVKFDITRFDNCFGYCKNADQWHQSHEELLNNYVTEYTRFTYIYSGLESLIDTINPPPAPRGGKINSICFYLKNQLLPEDIISFYLDVVQELKFLLQNTDINEQKILDHFYGNKYVSEHGIGLYVVYKLRNLFAHGAIGFPYPDENNKPISMYPTMVELSSKILLLTLQMIWLAFYYNSDITTSIHWESDIDEEYHIKEVLNNIHLKNFKNSYPTQFNLLF
jgi:hypothetical protein